MKKSKMQVGMLVVILMVIFVSVNVHALLDDQILNFLSPTLDDIKSQNTSIFDKVGELFDKIGELLTMTKNIFVHGVGWIINILIGSILEGCYKSVVNGMSKWVFLTPLLTDFEWIRNFWWWCFYIATGFTILGILLSTIRILRGDMKNDRVTGQFDAAKFIIVFLITIAGCYFSLFISNLIISGENMFLNSIASHTLWNNSDVLRQYAESASGEKAPLPLVTVQVKNPDGSVSTITTFQRNDGTAVTPDNISFNDFDGDTLMRMAYGLALNQGNVTEDPSDPDKLYQGCYNTTYYQFIKSTQYGFNGSTDDNGLMMMVIAMIVFILLGLFGLLRFFVVGILGAGSPFWFSYAVFRGDYDPIWGWINLFVRSSILSIFFDLAWIASVYITSNIHSNDFKFLNTGTQLIVSILFALALVVTVLFWFKWVIKAFTQPIQLAGTSVRETVGKASEKLGNSLSEIGGRYGISEITRTGARMEAVGKTQQDIAKDIKEDGRYNPFERGAIKDRLMEAKQTADKRLLEREIKASKTRGFEFKELGSANENIDMHKISCAGIKTDELKEALEKKQYQDVIGTSDGELFVDKDYAHAAEDDLKKMYVEKYMTPYELDSEQGTAFTNLDDRLSEIEKFSDDNRIEYKKFYSINSEAKQFKEKLEKIKDLSKSKGKEDELISNFKNIATHDFAGLEGWNNKCHYSAPDNKMADLAEKIFKRNEVDFKREGKNFIISEDFETVNSKLGRIKERNNDTVKNINKLLDMSQNGTFKYSGSDKEEYMSILDTLKSIDGKYTANEGLWINNQNKQSFLDKAVVVDEEASHESEDASAYVKVIMDNIQDVSNLKEIMEGKLPKGAVLESSKQKEIIVDREYVEKVKELKEEYLKLTPYWELNGYYYYRDYRGNDVKHSTPPKGRDGKINARYMGKFLKH